MSGPCDSRHVWEFGVVGGDCVRCGAEHESPLDDLLDGMWDDDLEPVDNPQPPMIYTDQDFGEPAPTWRTKRVLGRPWQYLLFAVGSVVFLVSLVPLLFTDAHIPTLSGLATAATLYLFAGAQTSYGNWLTVALTIATATIWLLLGLGAHF